MPVSSIFRSSSFTFCRRGIGTLLAVCRLYGWLSSLSLISFHRCTFHRIFIQLTEKCLFWILKSVNTADEPHSCCCLPAEETLNCWAHDVDPKWVIYPLNSGCHFYPVCPCSLAFHLDYATLRLFSVEEAFVTCCCRSAKTWRTHLLPCLSWSMSRDLSHSAWQTLAMELSLLEFVTEKRWYSSLCSACSSLTAFFLQALDLAKWFGLLQALQTFP